MITKVLLLTLIAIVFYFIIQSVRDGFQNANCQFKYTGTNFDDCLKLGCILNTDGYCIYDKYLGSLNSPKEINDYVQKLKDRYYKKI